MDGTNGNNNNYDGTYNSSFPAWWSGTDTCTGSSNITFTTDGVSSFGNILSLTANTTWEVQKNYDLWPKGVQDPTTELKYTPKWHILLGYKIQLQIMWD